MDLVQRRTTVTIKLTFEQPSNTDEHDSQRIIKNTPLTFTLSGDGDGEENLHVLPTETSSVLAVIDGTLSNFDPEGSKTRFNPDVINQH